MIQASQEKTASAAFPISAYRTNDIFFTLVFILAAVVLPAILAHSPQNQWLTGTAVNAILLLAVWRVGIANASLVAALPSSIALVRGLLPPPMAALIPYIIVSNIILIAVFFTLRKSPLTGILIAAFAKFLFLVAATALFAGISGPLVEMLHWPQLLTAVGGGLIALGTIRIWQKN